MRHDHFFVSSLLLFVCIFIALAQGQDFVSRKQTLFLYTYPPIVHSFGNNAFGQLGNDNAFGGLFPQYVNASGALFNKLITKCVAGTSHSLAVASDGSVFAFGLNDFGMKKDVLYNIILLGQLGDGSVTTRTLPVEITASGGLAGRIVFSIAAGQSHSLAATMDNRVFAWYYKIFQFYKFLQGSQFIGPIGRRHLFHAYFPNIDQYDGYWQPFHCASCCWSVTFTCIIRRRSSLRLGFEYQWYVCTKNWQLFVRPTWRWNNYQQKLSCSFHGFTFWQICHIYFCWFVSLIGSCIWFGLWLGFKCLYQQLQDLYFQYQSNRQLGDNTNTQRNTPIAALTTNFNATRVAGYA